MLDLGAHGIPPHRLALRECRAKPDLAADTTHAGSGSRPPAKDTTGGWVNYDFYYYLRLVCGT